jgi:hypothetical protein
MKAAPALGAGPHKRAHSPSMGTGQRSPRMERVMGIEPTLAAWEAAVLPLNYTRIFLVIQEFARSGRRLAPSACGRCDGATPRGR